MDGTTITTSIHNSVTLSRDGYASPLTVENIGEIAPISYGATGLLSSSMTAYGSIVNNGTIGGAEGYNGGPEDNGFAGGAGGTGVQISGPGALNNSGEIFGGSGGVGALGGGGLGGGGGSGGTGLTVGANVSVSNIGIILGGAGGAGNSGIGIGGGTGGVGGAGVSELRGLNFTNQGTIAGGEGGEGGAGDALFGSGGGGGGGGTGGAGGTLDGAGLFINNNKITGGAGAVGGAGNINGAGGVGGAGGEGLSISDNSVVFNNGSIIGGAGGGGGSGGPLGGSAGADGNGGAGVAIASNATLFNFGLIEGGTGGGKGTLDTNILSNNLAFTPADEIDGLGVYLNGGTLTNAGTIAGGAFQVAVKFGTAPGMLIVEPGAVFIGDVDANASAGDTLELTGTSFGKLSGVGTSVEQFDTISFASGSQWSVEGDCTGLASGQDIVGMSQGDTIILDGIAETGINASFQNGLELVGSETVTVNIAGAVHANDFDVTTDGHNTTIAMDVDPPCLARGTQVLTPSGNVVIEKLRQGDLITTISDGDSPILWIGRRRMNLRGHPRPEVVQPICFYQDSIADGVPQSDLLLSPDHALYLGGLLIPAKTFVNGATIVQLIRTSVTYYHIELSNHGIIFAEGAPVETYLETGNRGAFENGGKPVQLHPDFAQTLREAKGYAPFAETGPIVESVRQTILDRAGIKTTCDPDLRIHYKDGDAIIETRSAVPAEISADPRDRRRLGVKISEIKIGKKILPANHHALSEGWHDPEPDGRWTDGKAVIPNRVLGNTGSVSVKIVATLWYPVTVEPTFHRAEKS